MPPWLDYYRALTAHGVLMAIVFTFFFICGLALFAVYHTVKRERELWVAWIGYWLMMIGTLMATYEILAGNASVLYTFYAPLKADPWFYIGTTLIIVGTWIVGFRGDREYVLVAAPARRRADPARAARNIDYVLHVVHRDRRRGDRGRSFFPNPVVVRLG